MSGASPSVQPRFALTLLLAVCLALGGTGCATASRATLAAPPPEPVVVAEPVAEPAPALAPAKAERPKASAKRSTPKAEVKAPSAEAKAPASEARAPVAARTPELKRPQLDGPGAVLGATASEPVPFEPSAMTRPQRVSGREPQLTEQARAERVRGTALVRCVVRRDGRVTDCKLLNGLPYMDQELLEAVSTWHVTPATAQGQPVDVEYTFVVRISAS
ncbi:TonB family protein [Archangium sp.]|uniref:energy transducer TonB n=1 Tax=Archangium sp. TaxID=1872627 RepID=UPI00286C1C93|nr:TonB family protein [Archangium sp.]